MYKNEIPLFEIVSGASIAFSSMLINIPRICYRYFRIFSFNTLDKKYYYRLFFKKKNMSKKNENYIEGEIIRKKKKRNDDV